MANQVIKKFYNLHLRRCSPAVVLRDLSVVVKLTVFHKLQSCTHIQFVGLFSRKTVGITARIESWAQRAILRPR